MIIRCNLSSPEEDVGKSFLMIDVVFFGSYPVRGRLLVYVYLTPPPSPLKGKNILNTTTVEPKKKINKMPDTEIEYHTYSTHLEDKKYSQCMKELN